MLVGACIVAESWRLRGGLASSETSLAVLVWVGVGWACTIDELPCRDVGACGVGLHHRGKGVGCAVAVLVGAGWACITADRGEWVQGGRVSSWSRPG